MLTSLVVLPVWLALKLPRCHLDPPPVNPCQTGRLGQLLATAVMVLLRRLVLSMHQMDQLWQLVSQVEQLELLAPSGQMNRQRPPMPVFLVGQRQQLRQELVRPEHPMDRLLPVVLLVLLLGLI